LPKNTSAKNQAKETLENTKTRKTIIIILKKTAAPADHFPGNQQLTLP
jgi:hypothetical protein